MKDLLFQIKKEKEDKSQGIYVFEPLEQGFGQTLGNALRRVLLSGLQGAAITFVKIDGVNHQFSTVSGLREDVVELVLNIKKIRIAGSMEKPVKLTLNATGPGEVKAGDIETPAGIEIVNKDLVLGNLSDKKSKLGVEMTVEQGYGYSPFEERKSEILGMIPVDAIFSPVVKVNYRVEATRVGRVTDYDKLIMEVTTDGSIEPFDAVCQSASILITHFEQIVAPKAPKVVKEEKIQTSSEMGKLTVEELNLPTRIVNALERAGLKTVGDLLATPKKEIARTKNLGTKSVKIIEAALIEKGVNLTE